MSIEKREFYTITKLNEDEKRQLLYKYLNIKPMVCSCNDFMLILKPNGTVELVGEESHEGIDLTEWKGIKKICSGKRHIVGLKLDGSVVAVGNNEFHQCDVSDWKNIVDIFADFNCTIGLKADNNTLIMGQIGNDLAEDKLSDDKLEQKLNGLIEKANLSRINAMLEQQEENNRKTEHNIIELYGNMQSMLSEITEMYDKMKKLTPPKSIPESSKPVPKLTKPISEPPILPVLKKEPIPKPTPNPVPPKQQSNSIKSLKSVCSLIKEREDRIAELREQLESCNKKIIDGNKIDSGITHEEIQNLRMEIDRTKNKIRSLEDEKEKFIIMKNNIMDEIRKAEIAKRKSVYLSAGTYHTLRLFENKRTVVSAGKNDDGQCNVGNWENIVAVSAGHCHSVGLMIDGTVVAVGANEHGQCNVEDWKNIIAISAGHYHTVGLQEDGTVVAVGRNEDGQCNVEDWKNVTEVSAGRYHSVGLKLDGTVYATGRNEDGQCDVEDWTDIVAVSAGHYHTVGLKFDGTVVATGRNEDGQCNVDDWRDISAISAGGWHSIGLKFDGTVVAIGYNSDGRCDVDNWNDIVTLSAGNWYTVGMKSDGTILAVGDNEFGQCDLANYSS